MISKHHKLLAFSLIELLVSVTIILLLVGGALVGYTRYIDKQRLIAAAEKIQTGFREAQNMARVGYLGDCNEVEYVDFAFYNHAVNGLTYRIRLHCVGDSVDVFKNVSYGNMGLDFILNPNISALQFFPYGSLNKSVSSTLSTTHYSALFEIDQGGGIKVTYQ